MLGSPLTNILALSHTGAHATQLGVYKLRQSSPKHYRAGCSHIPGVNSPSKVAEVQNVFFCVKQQVLWLDVAVADAFRMDISQCPKELVRIQLHPAESTALSPDTPSQRRNCATYLGLNSGNDILSL